MVRYRNPGTQVFEDSEHESVSTEEELNDTHFVDPDAKSLNQAIGDVSAGGTISVRDHVSLGQDETLATEDVTLTGPGTIDTNGQRLKIDADDITLVGVTLRCSSGDPAGIIRYGETRTISNLTVEGVSIDCETNAQMCISDGGNGADNITLRDSTFKNSKDQSNVSFTSVNDITVSNCNFLNAGRPHVMIFTGSSDVTIEGCYFGAYMQRKDAPDGPIRIYGNDPTGNISINNNTFETHSADQGKVTTFFDAKSTAGDVVFRDNDVTIDSPDVATLMSVGQRSGQQQPESVSFIDNTFEVTVDIDEVVVIPVGVEPDNVLVQGNTIKINGGLSNIWRISGGAQESTVTLADNQYRLGESVTFSDQGGRFGGDITLRNEFVNRFPGQIVLGDHTPQDITVDNCTILGLTNPLFEQYSGTTERLKILNGNTIVSQGPPLGVLSSIDYLTIADNYLEDTNQGGTAIQNESTTITSKIIHDNHRNV
jgi:hypothetical protein